MNHTQILIEKVLPGELTLLHGISIQTFLETFSGSNTRENMEQYLAENMTEERLLQELQTDGSAFYFARIGNDIAGYLKINSGAAQTEFLQGPMLEIERIYVLQQFQGSGIGYYLMEEAFRQARAQGAAKVWLGVWEHNRKAITFYERQGFIAFDKHVFRLGDDEQTDIMMAMPVPDLS